MRILAAQINPIIGDVEGNAQKVFEALSRARSRDADIVLFPELTLSGYPPEDLLYDRGLIRAIQVKLEEIKESTKGLFVVVGLPRWNESSVEKPLFNSAAVLCDGELLGYHDKQLLPTYDVFDERRYFQPGKKTSVFSFQGKEIAITICEDLWQHSHRVGYTQYAVDPVQELQEKPLDLVLNLSSSPYYFRRAHEREVFSSASRALAAPLILCNQVGANDQLVFDGNSFFLNAKGRLISQAKSFVADDLFVDLDVNEAPITDTPDEIGDLYKAIVLGLRDYFCKQGFQKAVLGLSGGIDSAIVACIAKDALGSQAISAFYLPSRFSSLESESGAKMVAERLNLRLDTIDIEPMFTSALQTLKSRLATVPGM